MKRFYLIVFIAALVLGSCSLDDGDTNFYYAPLEIVNASVPDTFELGNVYTIDVSIFRPDDCTLADTFDVRRSATDTTNIRTVSAIGIILEKDVCNQVDQEIEDSFKFEVLYTEPYIFRFYTGDDENGDPQFLEMQVPVKNP